METIQLKYFDNKIFCDEIFRDCERGGLRPYLHIETTCPHLLIGDAHVEPGPSFLPKSGAGSHLQCPGRGLRSRSADSTGHFVRVLGFGS